MWQDVYDFAAKYGHVVVGGGDPVSLSKITLFIKL